MRFRIASALWASAFLAFAVLPWPASADESLAGVTNAAVTGSANVFIKDILAQAVPVGTRERPVSHPGLPTGLSYTLDDSIAFPYGNTGHNANLPGGFDAVVGYGLNKHVRLQAGVYTFQEYPTGFDSGIVPVYLQGLAAPIGTQNLAAINQDVTTRNRIVTASAQFLFTVGGKLPIIITPTYLARSGTVGGNSDVTNLEFDGLPYQVRFRTVEYYLVPVTLPVLSTPRMFATLTAAAQWNVNLNGLNSVGNHAQIFELAYIEYRASRQTTIFAQPSRLVNYLPSDATPQYIPTIIYGVSHKFTKNTFVQISASTGTPSNRQQLGVTALTCQRIVSVGGVATCPAASTFPTIAGLHAAQVQIQFGIGSPSVIPL